MIRVHKWLILALPILPATPAIAQHTNEVWLPGNGKACQTVCQTGGRLAVDSGPYKQSNLFYVCATNTRERASDQVLTCRSTLGFPLLRAR